MSPIVALLNEMRGKLGMYTGTTSITKLAAFLQGYACGLHKMGVEASFDFLAEFCDWIHERYHTKKIAWETIILQDSKDEADAVDHFWRLLDEFLATHPKHGLAAAKTPLSSAAGSGLEIASKSA